ncbi:MAG: FecR domain-containing protein [Verrucomicrobia bacterium]|nr:FecR domain-containing protein [Verrucomicrobiota bacterium]
MKTFAAVVMVLLFMSSLVAAKNEPVGKVIAVEGKAQANKRSLSRGSEIFVADVIQVAAASKIQIRFTDGGLLNLIEQTQYQIDSYQFNKTASDNFTANLVKGGFRTLTGDIGKAAPANVKVKTPVATIGIRGTTFSANMQNGQVYFGCDSGRLNITNDAGERTLEAGQFVSAMSMNQLGDVTTERPDALSPELFVAPPGGESIDEETAAQEPSLDESLGEEGEEGEEGEIEDQEIEVPEDEGNPPC